MLSGDAAPVPKSAVSDVLETTPHAPTSDGAASHAAMLDAEIDAALLLAGLKLSAGELLLCERRRLFSRTTTSLCLSRTS